MDASLTFLICSPLNMLVYFDDNYPFFTAGIVLFVELLSRETLNQSLVEFYHPFFMVNNSNKGAATQVSE